MRKLEQNSSSFLDSDPLVENFVDDFVVDGPLFAELFNPEDTIEVDENININVMDSEDEMEQYLAGKGSGSSGCESKSPVEVSRPQPQKVQNIEQLGKKAKLDKVHYPSFTHGEQTGRKIRPTNQTISQPLITRVEVMKASQQQPVVRNPRTASQTASQSSAVLERLDSHENQNVKKLRPPHKKLPPPVVVIETDDYDDDQAKREKCMNKNAVMARENRQKKKQYIQTLERNCEKLQTENFALKTSMESKDKQIKSMAQEIEYLRNVLANQTGLSALLKNIQNTSGLNFGTSFGQIKEGESSQIPGSKRSADTFDNAGHPEQVKKKSKTGKSSQVISETSTRTFEGPPTPCASPEPKTSGGVCLHVSNNNVSLEFCASCASAAEVWKVAGDHNYNRVPIKPDACDNANYVVVKEEIADYVVVKQEWSSSDEES